MLRIYVPPRELWNDKEECFQTIPGREIMLEHSLISISKWESKWHKPFLKTEDKTNEEAIDYIKCMSLNGDIDDAVIASFTQENIDAIQNYIADPMTASTVKKKPGKGNTGEQVTSELIYYWMVALEIPFECQKWHINRLLMLIEICNAKNQPSKKMPKREVAKHNSALNAYRKAKLNTNG